MADSYTTTVAFTWSSLEILPERNFKEDWLEQCNLFSGKYISYSENHGFMSHYIMRSLSPLWYVPWINFDFIYSSRYALDTHCKNGNILWAHPNLNDCMWLFECVNAPRKIYFTFCWRKLLLFTTSCWKVSA